MRHYSITSAGAFITVEPYWNVKQVKYEVEGFFDTITVEPYWNVKNKNENSNYFWHNYSRTILECKGHNRMDPCCPVPITVEPYWNVKPAQTTGCTYRPLLQ